MHGKIIDNRNKLREKNKELKTKKIQNKKELVTKIEKEKNEVIESFLKLNEIKKIYLFRMIDRIEIDKDKKTYIFFNSSQPLFNTKTGNGKNKNQV